VTELRERRRIAAAPRDVWRTISDVEQYPRWSPWTAAVVRVDRPAGLGVAYEERGRLLTPLPARLRWRIVEFDVGRRQVHRAEGAGLAASFERIFEQGSDGAGGTWLTLAVRYRPALGAAGRLLDRGALRGAQARRLARALDALERLAHTPGPRPVP
jgi:Polyketide cyclase / dehydrase and lipid transport